ncbi:MAG: hypothetical protein FNT15_08110 [Sulfurovum sp.]|jgi:hypothetical protein|nr:MAG: hypothetical protein FNT15_08110 [Sulfurovum sp.]
MNRDEALTLLENSGMDIKEVEGIFYQFKEDNEVVSMVAMNLSRRTSVYDKQMGKSETLISLLNELAKSNDMSSRWAVAKNHHTKAETLEFLAKDGINLVRALVATNPNTPVSVLSKFFFDEKIVRDGLSGNPNTPLKYLLILAQDSDKMVRLRVVENPSFPLDEVAKMADDVEMNVQKAVEVRLREVK